MSLIVETGSGAADADAYISVIDYKAWADKYGYSYAPFTDPQIEQAIRRATTYIDLRTFIGAQTHGRDQALMWPRKDLNEISNDVVPREIVMATAEATRRELATPGILFPDLDRGGDIIQKTERVEGVVMESTTYASGASPFTKFSAIEAWLAPLLGSLGTASRMLNRV